ncbi:unnamed protein product, partial [Ilex paraguariensis]
TLLAEMGQREVVVARRWLIIGGIGCEEPTGRDLPLEGVYQQCSGPSNMPTGPIVLFASQFNLNSNYTHVGSSGGLRLRVSLSQLRLTAELSKSGLPISKLHPSLGREGGRLPISNLVYVCGLG